MRCWEGLGGLTGDQSDRAESSHYSPPPATQCHDPLRDNVQSVTLSQCHDALHDNVQSVTLS